VELLSYVLIALAGYLLGSIPTGFLVARARGIDIRQVGSGNIGATNAFRVLGKPFGFFVLLVDAAKGYLACVGVPRWIPLLLPPASPQIEASLAPALIGGLTAVLGHNYTCWLGFKGGKGIATSAGVLAGWVPAGLGITFVTWIIVFALSRIVSLASLAAAVILPFAVWLTDAPNVFVGVTSLLSALAIYKHRPNIVRLWQGTEPRLGSAKPKSPDPT
jgi:acyl phosphate:glycerol-3-phosphate acyltransferase